MAEIDERLSRLISDEDSIKRVLELASSVISGQSGSSSQAVKQPNEQTEVPKNTANYQPDLSSVLGAFSSTASDKNTNDGNNGSVSNLLSIMPLLLQAMSGDTSLLQNDRINLIRAMRPYMSQQKADNIERAMRMASMTKVAKDILKLLGR